MQGIFLLFPEKKTLSLPVDALRLFFLQLDLEIWYYLNIEWQNAFLDYVIPFFRNQFFWVPLYLFLFVFMPLNYRRRGWYWLAGFLIAFALADYTSASIIKPMVGRLRPCNTPDLQPYVHLLVGCGSGLSFPSSHAANHFAFAAFIAGTLGKPYPKIRKWAWIWAILVGYSQVYVGVHFPLDVAFGALLGIVVGRLVARVYNRRFGPLEWLSPYPPEPEDDDPAEVVLK